jgi:tetratricopeptide (TPR) repeat protein
MASTSQEPAGGSIKDFKKPANPPVYGGRIQKGTKSTSTAKPDSVDPAATKPKADTLSKKSGGGFGSLSGGLPKRSTVATATARPKPSAPPTPGPTDVNQELEDAIAAGNDARSSDPPNYAEAEKAYRLAAKIDPEDSRPYEGLGNIFIDQRKYAEALVAYEQAVKAGSQNPEVFESLGDSYLAMGRFSDSFNASTHSIKLDAKRPGPYFTRAWINLYLKNGTAAGDDAQAMLERWQPAWSDEHHFYIAVVGYFGFRQAGRKDDAAKLLGEAAKACTSVAWVCQPIRYLSREQTAEEFIARATDNDKMTEAKTYVGVDLALEGKMTQALPYLEWVKANGNRGFYEYPLAVAWLDK